MSLCGWNPVTPDKHQGNEAPEKSVRLPDRTLVITGVAARVADGDFQCLGIQVAQLLPDGSGLSDAAPVWYKQPQGGKLELTGSVPRGEVLVGVGMRVKNSNIAGLVLYSRKFKKNAKGFLDTSSPVTVTQFGKGSEISWYVAQPGDPLNAAVTIVTGIAARSKGDNIKSIWFNLGTITTDVTPAAVLDKQRISALANTHAPIVQINKKEEFFPASVSWYLSRVSLMDQSGKLKTAHPTEATLESEAKTAPANAKVQDYLQIKSKVTFAGEQASAPFYVRFTQVVDKQWNDIIEPINDVLPGRDGRRWSTNWVQFYDIEYWFFYAYNGCSSVGVELEIGPANPSVKLQVPPFGTHEGDWEHLTVRIDANTLQLVALYTAEHGWGTWHLPGQFSSTGSRPNIYSAFHSHATYVKRATPTIRTANMGVVGAKIKIGLLDTTEDNLPRPWDPLGPGGPGVIVTSVNTPTLSSDLPWIKWKGCWGPPTDSKATINAASETIYKEVGSPGGAIKDGIRKLLGELAENIKDVSTLLPGGPTGPSAKGAWKAGEPSSPPASKAGAAAT